jgi:hypothetical protein
MKKKLLENEDKLLSKELKKRIRSIKKENKERERKYWARILDLDLEDNVQNIDDYINAFRRNNLYDEFFNAQCDIEKELLKVNEQWYGDNE